uniref:COR domain-containing protein n=1 Tax=Mesocestoides corti TaxID=53468 RepID=A0A5K3G062_MESCO
MLNTKAVLDYLKSLPRSSKPYNKVRLIVIGAPDVGKSTFVDALLRCEGQKAKTASTSASSQASVVSLNDLVVSRKAPCTSSKGWTETVNFTIWDFNVSNMETTATAAASKEVDEVTIASALQQFHMSRTAVYVVVWRATDGPSGLEVVTKLLVDIQCRAPNAPVFIVGTHADKLAAGETLEAAAAETGGCQWTMNEISDLVGRCFFRFSDPVAMGIPQFLRAHFILDCRDEQAVLPVLTAIHKAANFLKPLFRNPLSTRKPDSHQRLLSYPVPLLYHDLEHVTRDLASDLHQSGIPPIISLDDFIAEANARLQQLNSAAQTSSRGGFDSPTDARAAVAFLHEAGHVLYFSGATLHRAIVVDPPWLFGLLVRLLGGHTSAATAEAKRKSPFRKVKPDAEVGAATPLPPPPPPTPTPPYARAGVLNLSRLKDLLTANEVPQEGPVLEQLMGKFHHLEVSFALTYLVGLLAKFELAVPLDSQHLLIPALLPSTKNTPLSDPSGLQSTSRQIRLTPKWTADSERSLLEDSDPLDCSVYTLPRKKKDGNKIPGQAPPLHHSDSLETPPPTNHRRNFSQNILSKLTSWQSSLVPRSLRGGKSKGTALQSLRSPPTPLAAESFPRHLSPLSTDLWRLVPPHPPPYTATSFLRGDPVRQATRIHRGYSVTPPWELQPDCRNEVLRVYALTYIPAGFWTRLITRLLTDSHLNSVCGNLYNLSSIQPELAASLLTMEPSSAQSAGYTESSDGGCELFPGWSLSRTGLQMTLAGGSIPVFTLEQVGESASSVIAMSSCEIGASSKHSIAELGAEANELTRVKEPCEGALTLCDRDFKAWDLRLLRLSTGAAEAFRECSRGQDSRRVANSSGLLEEPFG